MKSLAFISFLLLLNNLNSQSQLSFKFIDQEKNKPIPGLTISINNELKTTNSSGIIQYESQDEVIEIKTQNSLYYLDTVLTILSNVNTYEFVLPLKVLLNTIEKNEYGLVKRELSIINLTQKDILNTPTLLGEKDPLKTLQLVAGVSNGQEGSSYIYVRGGNPGENLILLDDVPLTVSSHILGMISNINPNIIDNVKFYKAGFPSEYGNRLSSVIDIKTKDANYSTRSFQANIGILSSSLDYSTPLKSDKVSLFTSIKTSPLPVFKEIYDLIKSSNSDFKSYQNYYFFDTYNKVSFNPNKKLSGMISFFKSWDKTKDNFIDMPGDLYEIGAITKSNSFSKWDNYFVASKFKYRFNNFNAIHFFANVSKQGLFIESDDNFKVFSNQQLFQYENYIKTERIGAKYTKFFNNNVSVDVGILFESNGYRNFEYIKIPNKTPTERIFEETQMIGSGYINFKGKLLKNKLNLNAGLRYNSISRVDEKSFKNVEPRLDLTYSLLSYFDISLAASKMSQQSHLLTRENIGLPYQIWLASNKNINPGLSNQIGLGVVFHKNDLYISGDVYHKESINLVQANKGQNILIVETNGVETTRDGIGKSYGFEFTISKIFESFGKATLNYTLSKSTLLFAELNKGNEFPNFGQRIHNLNVTFDKQISSKWSAQAGFFFQSGYPFSIPETIIPSLESDNFADGALNIGGFTSIEDNILPFYKNEILFKNQYDISSINNDRTKSHHRLDLNFTKKIIKGKSERALSFGIYNVYFRKNPFSTYLSNGPQESVLVNYTTNNVRFYKASLSIFNFVPYVSYRITI